MIKNEILSNSGRKYITLYYDLTNEKRDCICYHTNENGEEVQTRISKGTTDSIKVSLPGYLVYPMLSYSSKPTNWNDEEITKYLTDRYLGTIGSSTNDNYVFSAKPNNNLSF